MRHSSTRQGAPLQRREQGEQPGVDLRDPGRGEARKSRRQGLQALRARHPSLVDAAKDPLIEFGQAGDPEERADAAPLPAAPVDTEVRDDGHAEALPGVVLVGRIASNHALDQGRVSGQELAPSGVRPPAGKPLEQVGERLVAHPHGDHRIRCVKRGARQPTPPVSGRTSAVPLLGPNGPRTPFESGPQSAETPEPQCRRCAWHHFSIA